MKLPLIVRCDSNGELYHVLQFDRGYAIAVNPRTLNIEEMSLSDITALSEPEYEEWKKASLPNAIIQPANE